MTTSEREINLERLVTWALDLGLSTGHADTAEDLLNEVAAQIKELQATQVFGISQEGFSGRNRSVKNGQKKSS